MKTKRESKFTLEKFEVAKLKSSTMRKVVGGLGDDVITVTGSAGQNSSSKCVSPPPPKP